jgi:opacity protein-like surface antigen
VRKITALLCGLFLFGSSAYAQIVPKANIFVGYSFLRSKVFPGSGPPGFTSNDTGNLNGWEGSLEGKVFPFIGIVADFSGHYGSHESTITGEAIPTPPCVPIVVNVHANLHTYMFGPRASVSVGRFTPFAEALLGAAHVSESATNIGFSHSDTSFATAIGGGIDYKLFPVFAWRFQGDWLQTRVLSNTQSNFRFSTGPVLRF